MSTANEPGQIPPRGENVFAWERTEIEEAFTPLDPANARKAAMDYSNVATQWDQGLETFSRSIKASIAEAWEGTSADAAKDAITRYTTDAHQLTALITRMSNDMEAAADAIPAVVNGIPEANHHSWTANVWPPRAAEEERTRNEATAGARAAMLDNYVNRFAAIDGRVPVLSTALDPTNPLDIPAVGPGNDGGGGGGGGGNGGGGNGGSNPTGSQPTDPTEPGDDPAKTEEPGENNLEDTATDPATTTSPQTQPSSTTPSPANPGLTAPTTPSTTTTPSAAVPGSPSWPGGPSGSGSPSSTPSPGRSVPGVPGAPGATTPAPAAANAAAATRGGMPGMGGMGAGAGRGKGDEENTRQTPDYLVNAENAAELIGDLPRTVPGGVIGEDPAPTPTSARD